MLTRTSPTPLAEATGITVKKNELVMLLISRMYLCFQAIIQWRYSLYRRYGAHAETLWKQTNTEINFERFEEELLKLALQWRKFLLKVGFKMI